MAKEDIMKFITLDKNDNIIGITTVVAPKRAVKLPASLENKSDDELIGGKYNKQTKVFTPKPADVIPSEVPSEAPQESPIDNE